MNHLLLVMKREYLNKVKNKSFIVMTFLSPLIFLGLVAAVAYLSQLNNSTVKTVAVLDEAGILNNEFLNSESVKFQNLDGTSLEDAKRIVKEGKLYGLLYVPDKASEDLARSIEFFSEEAPSFQLVGDITKRIEDKLFNLNLKNQGVDLSKIEESKPDVDIILENFSGEKTSKMGNALKLVFGGASGYLLMMFIIIYGNMIMRSVIEEKTNRIIEIIISSVKPIQLMMGKIFGTCLAGITQFFMWVIVSFILILVVGAVFNINMLELNMQQHQAMMELGSVPQDNMQQIVQNFMVEIFHLPLAKLLAGFLVYFLGGYLLYSSMYAAIGAAVDNETDTQQFIFPLIMPLMLGIYVGFFTVIEDPHGTVSTIFSFIPLTSPIVMLMRIPFGVPWWEILLSVLLLYGTFMVAVWFAAKIYRVGILMYGKKPTYKEIYKWLRY